MAQAQTYTSVGGRTGFSLSYGLSGTKTKITTKEQSAVLLFSIVVVYLYSSSLRLIRSVPRHQLNPLLRAAVTIDQITRTMIHGKVRVFHHQADAEAADDDVQTHQQKNPNHLLPDQTRNINLQRGARRQLFRLIDAHQALSLMTSVACEKLKLMKNLKD